MRNGCGKPIIGFVPFAVGLLFATAAQAQQDTISTDRPGLGLSPSVVPPGAVQIELGLPAVELTRDGGTDDRLVNFPGLLRVGVTDGLELRLCSPLYNLERSEEDAGRRSSEGFGPVELGAKLGFTMGDAGPELAIIPSLVLPVGDDEFAGTRTAFMLNGVAGWSLPAGLGLDAVAGLSVDPDENDDYTASGAFVGTLTRTVIKPLAVYGEAGWFPTAGAPNPAYVGGGATYLLTDRLQVDGYFDRGLSSGAADWLFGAGVSVRF